MGFLHIFRNTRTVFRSFQLHNLSFNDKISFPIWSHVSLIRQPVQELKSRHWSEHPINVKTSQRSEFNSRSRLKSSLSPCFDIHPLTFCTVEQSLDQTRGRSHKSPVHHLMFTGGPFRASDQGNVNSLSQSGVRGRKSALG